MHELSLMESVVDAVVEQADQRVALVRLEIGELAGVAIARMRCHRCGSEQATHAFATACTCGSFDRELVVGGELRLKEVEVL